MKWKRWPSTEGARMSHEHKTDAIFFDLFYEVFPKQTWTCFRIENKNFLKRKGFYLENICETKVFSKRKWNCFCFWNENILICNESESVSETKIKFFWNENICEIKLEFFCFWKIFFFFWKNCQKQEFFRVTRMGHQTAVVYSKHKILENIRLI